MNSQDRIQKDGTFGHITRDLTRPFGLRAHGYEPVDVQLSDCKGHAVDIGTIRLRKLALAEQRPLSGRVEPEGSTDASSATIELKIGSGPRNLYGSGHRAFGGNRVTFPCSADGTLKAEGFSPAKYTATIKAPGYVPRYIQPDFRSDAGADIGLIRLVKQKIIRLEYLSQPESTSDEPFDGRSPKQATLAGGESWIADGHRDATLRLRQESGGLNLGILLKGTRFKHLGAGVLSDFLSVPRSSEGLTDKQPAMDGHVYFVHVKSEKCYLLVRVTFGELVRATQLPSRARAR